MSFWRNYYHLVWATKERQPFIQPHIEHRLFDYIEAKARELEVVLYAINGTADHIHLVAAIPPKQSVAAVVQHLKGASSHFVNAHLHPAEFHFAWQDGYGCLTVGERYKDSAVAYVLAQKEHHAQGSTNGWLERCSLDEEGPTAIAREQHQVAEERATYDVSNSRTMTIAATDPPF